MFSLFRHRAISEDEMESNGTKDENEKIKGCDDELPTITRLPVLNKGCLIEVLDTDYQILEYVRIIEYDKHRLEMGRLPGDLELKKFDKDCKLILRGMTSDNEEFLMSATVDVSTLTKLCVVDQEAMEIISRRQSVRYSINNMANLYDLSVFKSGAAIPAKLINISMDGACVSVDKDIDESHILRLRVELYKNSGPISFRCKIVRKRQSSSDCYIYGLLFEQLDSRRKRYLKDDINEFQRIMRSKTQI